MNYLIMMFILLFCIGCNESGKGGGSSKLTPLPEIVDEIESSSDIDNSLETPDEDSNTGVDAKIFYFSSELGKCLDENQLEGYNAGVVECGDLSYQSVNDINLKDKTLYGLNLKGASIANSKISFHNIADKEMLINFETYFENKKNAFTSLYDQHLNIYKREKNKALKHNQKIIKLNERIDIAKENYLKYSEKPSKQLQIQKNLEKYLADKEKYSKAQTIALAKRDRHLEYSISLYPLALEEPAYSNPKINNKKSLVFNGEYSYIGEASNSYFSDNQFTISVWFRTLVNQEARLVNFHSQDKPRSSINLSLKKGVMIAGYRDSNDEYTEIRIEENYNTNDWQLLTITYDESTFKFYLNGELKAQASDDFSGFGSAPLHLGSFDNKLGMYVGELDELSLWDSALSSEGVGALFLNGQATNLKRHLEMDKLSIWWRLGDGQKDPELEKDTSKKNILHLTPKS